MDIKKLNYFIHVAELGSLTRASVSLGIEQSTLSRHIRALEEELSVPLFHRDGRGVNITVAGEKLLARSRRIMGELSMLTHDLAMLTEEPSGRLRVGMLPTVCELISERLLQQFGERFPRMTIEIIEGFNGALCEWLAAGRLDAAIVYLVPATRGLVAEALLTEHLAFSAHPDHAAAMDSAIHLGTLQGVPLALPGTNNGLRTIIDMAAKKAGVELYVRYEINSIPLIRQLIRSGTACSILPVSATRKDQAERVIAVREIGSPPLARTLILANATQVPSTHPLRRLNGMLKEVLRAAVPGAAVPTGADAC